MRSILATLLLAGAVVMSTHSGASAQASKAYDYAPGAPTEPQALAARPYGATYIPGVGFRYLAAGGPVVYGYYRARGYRAYRSPRRCTQDWLFGDRCRGWR
jgi:hypothetical protein